MKFNTFLHTLNPLNLLRQPFAVYIFIGLVCGLAAVAFHLSIEYVFEYIVAYQHDQPQWLSIILMILSPALGGLIVGLVLFKIEPSAGGSGIPQSKAAYWNKGGILSLKETFWRYILGVVSIGSGNSLGREGPTVHLCASIASQIGQMLKLRYDAFREMIPVGIGAGIAAAFNAPLAAVTFVIEELLLHSYKTKTIAGIVFAAVIAASVERIILGSDPVYNVNLPDFGVEWWMLICVPIGIIGGFTGHFFIQSLLKTRQKFKDLHQVPLWLKPAIGGLLMGMVGTLVYVSTGHHGLFGLGYTDLSDALNGHLLGVTLVILFVGKIVATILSYSSGGSGGIFAPTLFIGTMMGSFIGYIVSLLFALDPVIVGGAALMGMGAFFAGSIRAPFTSVLIIYEMTHNYSLILPLMFGNMIAFNIAEKLNQTRVYDALLIQDGIYLNYHAKQDRGS